MTDGNKFRMPWKIAQSQTPGGTLLWDIVNCDGELLVSHTDKDLADHIVGLAEYHQEYKGMTAKLFIWNNPYQVNYGGSIIYAVAETEQEARSAAANAMVISYGEYEQDRLDNMKLGKPTRVLDAPYAECYHWSE